MNMKAISIQEILESSKMINKLLDEEVKILGDSQKVYIGGFS